ANDQFQRRSDAAAAVIAADLQGSKNRTGNSANTPAATPVAAPEPMPGNTDTPSSNANPTGSMKQDPATRGAGGGKRDYLSGPDPNAVPRAIADDSKRPQ